MTMLRVAGVSKTFRVGAFGGGTLQAVRDVTFDVEPGEVVSLIGESGSGKTTIGRMILRLTTISSGSIVFEGTDIAGLQGGTLRSYYRSVQGVFQDPFSSCNPIFKVDRVFDTIHDAFFPDVPGSEWDGRVAVSLDSVNLRAEEVLHKFPHQLSGGQLQRLLIARALLLDIRFLVADEIISMLDASTRIDVLNLLGELKERGLGILFITHDLSLGNYISDRTMVLRRGRIVEMGDTRLVFGDPRHPYTRMLLSSVPTLARHWETEPAQAALGQDAPDGLFERPLVEATPGHLVADLAE
jgi:peptide/nickel transport system ATP-binding protein